MMSPVVTSARAGTGDRKRPIVVGLFPSVTSVTSVTRYIHTCAHAHARMRARTHELATGDTGASGDTGDNGSLSPNVCGGPLSLVIFASPDFSDSTGFRFPRFDGGFR